MSRSALSAVSLIALILLAGCAQTQSPPQQEAEEPDEPDVEQTSEAIDYEFEPYSSLDQMQGWPSSVSSAPYFVSVPIETECHWVEAESLIGPDIAETIDFDQPLELEALACGFTATPQSDRDDLVDEVAWRVDAGVEELVEAYAATIFADGTLNCEPVDVPRSSPGLSVKYLDSWYVVRPGSIACAETVERITAATGALMLTEVLRHTTSFDDYLARGF